MVKRLTKLELKGIVQYDNKENYLLMPNEVIEMLVKDEELNKKKAPHVAFAYTYLYMITWLYRYAKYGVMSFEDVTKSAILKMMGIAETSSEYNYIVKKGGVLDRLGLTATLSYTEAPINWWTNEEDSHGFPEFTYFYELEETIKQMILNGQTTKRRQFKEPLLATGYRNPLNEEEGEEAYNGTFYEGGKEYTHLVGFDVFLECITNPSLGFVAFYLYAFIKVRMGANTEVSISLEGITKYSGILPTTRDKYLKELKGFGLIRSLPENYCLERGGYHTEPSTYWVKEATEWLSVPNYNFPKRNVYHVSKHVDYVESSMEITA
ncbi:hypothetical protein [Niallia sp. FSL W8-1348]|uniref:hypothetical protein n=1 Tax=Niallia sp. FSL W8-1348 TaxID=2954656 RepID=UPI0030F91C4C